MNNLVTCYFFRTWCLMKIMKKLATLRENFVFIQVFMAALPVSLVMNYQTMMMMMMMATRKIIMRKKAPLGQSLIKNQLMTSVWDGVTSTKRTVKMRRQKKVSQLVTSFRGPFKSQEEWITSPVKR